MISAAINQYRSRLCTGINETQTSDKLLPTVAFLMS